MLTSCYRLLLVFCLLTPTITLSAQNVDYSRISFRLADSIQALQYSRQTIRVGIELLSDLDLQALDQQLYREKAPLSQRASTVITALKNEANAKQPAFIQFLAGVRGVRLSTVDRFWISNLLFVNATADAIRQISRHPGVSFIDIDAQLLLDEPIQGEPLPANGERINAPGGHEPGHDAIGAPQMWSMGYTGLGRLAMSMDVGVDPVHPALSWKWQGNFKPLGQSWFEYQVPGSTPYDCDASTSHGTHTMGTILGWDPATNDTIGVAPNGRWIHSPSLCSSGGTSANIAGFQWALDPDGNPGTTSDMPDVINNSWYDPNTTNECNGLYRSTLDALEAVGVAVVFSAGNSGANASTITQPKNINNDTVSVFCVGATQKTAPYAIASFSSRGPSDCGGTGTFLIKPEVSAPGVSVRSAQGNNGYGTLSGTSMAAPHACGAILLLKEAFPNLTGRQLKLALYYTAVDLGTPGEDNDYGMGIINVPAAYNWLLSQGHTPAAYNHDAGIADLLEPGTSTCNTTLAPEIDLYNDGNATLTSLTIEYTITPGNISNTFNWTGNLLPGQSTQVVLPTANLSTGNYTITVQTSLPNGQADERPYNDCFVREFEVLQGAAIAGDSLPCAGSVTLNANQSPGINVAWFTAPTGGTQVGTGNSFTTPTLNSTTTYYVDLATTVYGGKPDNSGGGSYYGNDQRWLIFNVLTPLELKSVLVYAGSAGNRTFGIWDAGNNMIHTTTVNVPAGQSRVNLNWQLPTGNDYTIRVVGNVDLYRNNSGINFPYDIPGVISIYETNASSSTAFYYFFYDWEIEYGNVCGRVPVTVTVDQFMTSIQASATQVNLAVSGTVNFNDNTTNHPAQSWAWDFGDGNTSSLQNPSHTYTAVGTYTVTLTVMDGSGCTATDTLTVTVTNSVGIDQPDGRFQALEIYPNPSSGLFRVRMELDAEWPVKLEVFNALGELVATSQRDPVRRLGTELDLRDKARGVYYLRVTAGGQSMVRKLLRN